MQEEDSSQQDRCSWYRWLREQAPVYRTAEGVWVLSRFEDVVAAGRDHARFSSYFGNDPEFRHVAALPSMDPPEHRHLRRSVAAPFHPSASRRYAALVEDVVRSATERLTTTRRPVDAIRAFAALVPTAVLGSAIGVEARSLAALADRGAAHRHAFFSRLLRERGETSGSSSGAHAHVLDDLAAGIASERLNEADAVSFLMLLMAAGMDTVRDLLGEIVLLATTKPSFWDDLARRHDESSAVAEELLRWISPLQAVYRTTNESIELPGAAIPSHVKVMLLLASANRDGDRWRRAEVLDLDRYSLGAPDHVAFGAGPHRCLGATLARMQVVAVLQIAPRQISGFEPAGAPARRPSRMVRGLQTMPVVVHGSGA